MSISPNTPLKVKRDHYFSHRVYASLLILGSGILLFRTVKLLSQGVLELLVLWVSILLITELLIDLACFLSSIRWWIKNDPRIERISLRLGAIAAFLHALRVMVFVLGRVGPWIDFDVRPEHRALHHTQWSWGWLYFAAIMSLLGLFGVVLIWRSRQRANKRK